MQSCPVADAIHAVATRCKSVPRKSLVWNPASIKVNKRRITRERNAQSQSPDLEHVPIVGGRRIGHGSRLRRS